MHHNHSVAGGDGAHIGWASGECLDVGDGDDGGEDGGDDYGGDGGDDCEAQLDGMV